MKIIKTAKYDNLKKAEGNGIEEYKRLINEYAKQYYGKTLSTQEIFEVLSIVNSIDDGNWGEEQLDQALKQFFADKRFQCNECGNTFNKDEASIDYGETCRSCAHDINHKEEERIAREKIDKSPSPPLRHPGKKRPPGYDYGTRGYQRDYPK